MVACIRRGRDTSALFPPCEHTARRQRRESSHQEPNWTQSWSWTSHHPKLWEIHFCCLIHLIYGILLWYPEQTITTLQFFMLNPPLHCPSTSLSILLHWENTCHQVGTPSTYFLTPFLNPVLPISVPSFQMYHLYPSLLPFLF